MNRRINHLERALCIANAIKEMQFRCDAVIERREYFATKDMRTFLWYDRLLAIRKAAVLRLETYYQNHMNKYLRA